MMAEPGGFVQRARAAGEQEALRAVFRVDLVFVRQVVADGGDVEIAGFDGGFDGFGDGRLYALLLIARVPGRAVFEILRVGGDFAEWRRRASDR